MFSLQFLASGSWDRGALQLNSPLRPHRPQAVFRKLLKFIYCAVFLFLFFSENTQSPPHRQGDFAVFRKVASFRAPMPHPLSLPSGWISRLLWPWLLLCQHQWAGQALSKQVEQAGQIDRTLPPTYYPTGRHFCWLVATSAFFTVADPSGWHPTSSVFYQLCLPQSSSLTWKEEEATYWVGTEICVGSTMNKAQLFLLKNRPVWWCDRLTGKIMGTTKVA